MHDRLIVATAIVLQNREDKIALLTCDRICYRIRVSNYYLGVIEKANSIDYIVSVRVVIRSITIARYNQLCDRITIDMYPPQPFHVDLKPFVHQQHH